MSDWARQIDRRTPKDQTANIPTKGGRNVTYDYVSVEGMIDVANRVAAALGERWHIRTCKLVQVMDFLAIELEAVAVNAEGKERTSMIQVPVASASGAPVDKAVLGTVTRATVYVLRGMFGIVEGVAGDEADVNARPEVEEHTPVRATPKPNAKYPEPASNFYEFRRAVVWVKDTYAQTETIESIRDTIVDMAQVRGIKAKDFTDAQWAKLNDATRIVCDSYLGAQ